MKENTTPKPLKVKLTFFMHYTGAVKCSDYQSYKGYIFMSDYHKDALVELKLDNILYSQPNWVINAKFESERGKRGYRNTICTYWVYKKVQNYLGKFRIVSNPKFFRYMDKLSKAYYSQRGFNGLGLTKP